MKKIFFCISIFLISSWIYAQVTIDQVIIKIDSAGYDSAYVRYTSYLGELDYIGGSVFNNGQACIVQHNDLMFSGDSNSSLITKDTSFKIGYLGLVTGFFKLETIWDTSVLVLPPSTLIFMDSYIYDSCGLTSIQEAKSNIYFSLFPNPANSHLQLKIDRNIEFTQAHIYQANGKLIESLQSSQYQIDVSQFTNGIYLIKIETNQGTSIKKFIVSH